MKWKYEKDKLFTLIVIEEKSYEEIGKMYSCTGSNIKKVAKRLGIPLKQKRKINEKETFNKGTAKTAKCLNCGCQIILYKTTNGKFCSSSCQSDYQYKEFIKKWKNNESIEQKNPFVISKHIRRYIFEKNNYCCEICGENLVNPYTNKSILQIHHKDGNCLNNKEENLQLLCPNHHAMTENYGSRNKNGNKERTSYFGKSKSDKKNL